MRGVPGRAPRAGRRREAGRAGKARRLFPAVARRRGARRTGVPGQRPRPSARPRGRFERIRAPGAPRARLPILSPTVRRRRTGKRRRPDAGQREPSQLVRRQRLLLLALGRVAAVVHEFGVEGLRLRLRRCLRVLCFVGWFRWLVARHHETRGRLSRAPSAAADRQASRTGSSAGCEAVERLAGLRHLEATTARLGLNVGPVAHIACNTSARPDVTTTFTTSRPHICAPATPPQPIRTQAQCHHTEEKKPSRNEGDS